MRRIRLAISFLTIIPTGNIIFTDSEELVAAASYFPAAGAVLGIVMGAVAYFGSYLLPVGPVVVLVLAAEFLLTRGLHIDGLADMADGFFGGFDKERIFTIMKDSAVGPMGACIIFFVYLFKYAALLAAGAKNMPILILMMCISSRWSMVLAGAVSVAAKKEGLGSILIDGLGWRHFILASLTGVILLTVTAFLQSYYLLPLLTGSIFSLLAGIAVAAFVSRILEGLTGDILGAVNELAEAGFLLGALLYWGAIAL